MATQESPDHDQRFKTLLVEFFREFLSLFFPTWAERFDLSAVEWLPQEVFPDPPQGERRALDLVGRVPLLAGVEAPFPEGAAEGFVLIHLEVESNDRIARFRRRFFEYYCDLRRKYDLPVWPIGVFLRVGLDGVGWASYEETFWEQKLLQFWFAYVGLPALDAETYLYGENLLGVALTSLMRVPRERRVELHAEGLDRIVHARDNEWRRYLLAECLQAYSDFDPAEWERLQELLITDKYKEARQMTLTYFERGKIQGEVLGERNALQRMAMRQLEVRFGPLPTPAKERLAALSVAQLEQLILDFVHAKSLKDLGLGEPEA
jgi:hypothetical protein